MVSLQEDVKLDCSYKVLAEDKPVLSNYPPKLHKKLKVWSPGNIVVLDLKYTENILIESTVSCYYGKS